jgi:hypothetical protein
LQARSDSNGTTQLSMEEFALEKTNQAEYILYPASLRSVSESTDDEDTVPIHTTLKPKAKIGGIKLLSERDIEEMAKNGEVTRWSSDNEGDEVQIKQTIQTKTNIVLHHHIILSYYSYIIIAQYISIAHATT